MSTTNHQQSFIRSFYIVSKGKFITLYLATFGLYGFYWCYKNWWGFKKNNQVSIWLFPRALLDILFFPSLIKRMVASLEPELRVSYLKEMGWLASQYIGFALLGRIGDRLSQQSIGLPSSFYLSVISLPFACRALYLLQKVINDIMGDTKGISNSRLSWINIFWISAGLVYWLTVLIPQCLRYTLIPYS
ncbi:hypothetical protein BOO31_02305 [Vibrio navarrensis]|nr:hypothetical protein [Vibrio navarrensis]